MQAALRALSYLLYIVYATALRRAFRITRRGILGAYFAIVAVTIAAVAPLAADPALLRAQIPGMAVAQRFAGHGFAVTVGIGGAVSVAGVILVEYLALSRLTTAVTAWPLRRVVTGVGVVMAASALAVYGRWTTIQTTSI